MTRPPLLDDFTKTRPYAHQRECFELSKDRETFAIFLEQGLGKTKIVLDTVTHLHLAGKIDGLFVVAPNGVHSNWIQREVPVHLSDRVTAMCLEWRSRSHATKRFQSSWHTLSCHDGLSVFAMNVEALSSGKKSAAVGHAEEFLKTRRCLMVVDESSRIKTPRSLRTRNVVRLGKLAPYRRITTGLPVGQSPFDLYAQFGFLDRTILGFKSYYAFRHQHGVFQRQVAVGDDGRSWQYENLVRYVRMNELGRSIRGHSMRRVKAECLDLPPKIYQRVPVEMSVEQKKCYAGMMKEGVIEIPDEGIEVLAPLKITRLMRCQQILGGFLPTPEPREVGAGLPVPGPNPKLTTLVELLTDDYAGKTIIWARFRYEIEMIATALRRTFGRQAVVEFHGGVTAEHRQSAIDLFQEDPDVRFFVSQQQSGIGITLTAAECVFYYSNGFSREQRLQSEDRAHRIGTKKSVVYVDLEMRGTVDERIRDVLHAAGQTADAVMGDTDRMRTQR